MDSSEIPVKFNETLLSHDYERLKRLDKNKCLKDNLLGFIGCIPAIGAWVSAAVESGMSYSDAAFFRKMFVFIYDLKDISQTERQKFATEIEATANDMAGNVICDMINRLDNINKAEILANLVIAKINGEIEITDFFRLSAAVERIAYPDFGYLKQFEAEKYIEGGVTESLYASGALNQSTMDSDGNSYSLSALGQKILKYGLLDQEVVIDAKNATGIQTIGAEDIEKMVNRTIESGNDNKAMFDLDLVRGK